MKHVRTLSLLAALALLTPAPLFGQEGRGAAPRERAAQEHDAALRLPTYVRAHTGPTAVVHDEAGASLGVVRDYLADRKSGQVLSVVVAVEREGATSAHLVPWKRFVWDPAKRELRLPMTAEELAALPVHEPGHVAGHMGEHMDGHMGGREKDAEGPAGGMGREGAMHAEMPREVAATATVGTQLVAGRKPFASVSELLLETRTGALAFALATPTAPDAEPYLIPWQAMTWESAGKSEKSHLRLSVPAENLDTAPRLKVSNLKRLEDAGFLRSVYAFYELSPPEGLGTQG